jgi:hypothetical protein
MKMSWKQYCRQERKTVKVKLLVHKSARNHVEDMQPVMKMNKLFYIRLLEMGCTKFMIHAYVTAKMNYITCKLNHRRVRLYKLALSINNKRVINAQINKIKKNRSIAK